MLINSVGGGGGIELSLVISVASGSVVTATLGSKSVSGTAVDGMCVLTLPEAGTWTVQATLGGKTTEARTVTVPLGMALEYGTPLSEMAVGSSVYTNVNGVRTEFLVVNQGKPGSMYDDSCAGTWLLAKNVYENRGWDSTNGQNKYENSDIHSYLNSTFLNLLSIKGVIKQVKIPYRKNGGQKGSNQIGANGLSCRVFLLSGYEVGFTSSDTAYLPQDGEKLNYFDTGSVGNDKRVASLNGADADWALRSPCTYNTDMVTEVKDLGNYNFTSAEVSNGIRPALILPSDTLVSSDGTISV